MKHLLWGFMMFVFATRVYAHEASVFVLGYDVREGQVIVEKSAITLKTAPQTMVGLTGPAAPKAASVYLAGLEALVAIERFRADVQADKIERQARELSEKGSVTPTEFARCLDMVKTLRKTHDDLDRIWQELDRMKVKVVDTTR